MINDGVVKGLPLIQYKDTKANIEALSAITGMLAYATDTNELGFYRESDWLWISTATLGSISDADLDDLADVNAPSPSQGDVLTWSGSEWVSQAASGFLSDLNDVSIEDPDTNDVLTWSGSAWVSQAQQGGSSGDGTISCMFTQTADVTVGNSDTETTLLGTGVGTLTFAADAFTVGKTVKIHATGYFSTKSSPGTFTWRFKIGTDTVASVAQIPPSALTTDGWYIDAIVTCRTTGASGQFRGQGGMFWETSSTDGTIWRDDTTANSTIDTTGSLTVDLTAQWGTADVGNTITCTNAVVTVLN